MDLRRSQKSSESKKRRVKQNQLVSSHLRNFLFAKEVHHFEGWSDLPLFILGSNTLSTRRQPSSCLNWSMYRRSSSVSSGESGRRKCMFRGKLASPGRANLFRASRYMSCSAWCRLVALANLEKENFFAGKCVTSSFLTTQQLFKCNFRFFELIPIAKL